MKLVQAMPGMPNPVTEAEVEKFLESKLNIQLATIDAEGYPNIQPIWFYYDKKSGKYTPGPKRRRKRSRTYGETPAKSTFPLTTRTFRTRE